MTAGTAISATHGFVRSPETKPTTYLSTQEYTMFWYQPTYESSYAITSLRRYNGGEANGDKIKAYCAMLRPSDSGSTSYTSATALVPETLGGTGIITLQGATTLAAGAIALGTIALAF